MKFFATDAVGDNGRVGPDDDKRVERPGGPADVVVKRPGSKEGDRYVPFDDDGEPKATWSHSFELVDGGVLVVSVTKFVLRVGSNTPVWARSGEPSLVLAYAPHAWATVEGTRGDALSPNQREHRDPLTIR